MTHENELQNLSPWLISNYMLRPKTEISKFINAYKSASSRLIKKEYPKIRENIKNVWLLQISV